MDNIIPHILIVDDDPNLLTTMSDILKLKGFDPVIAQTGGAALAQLEGQSFDLALIDLRLEDMSGLKVLSAIKARSPETECILLTGHASQNSAIEAIQMGVYGYFQKPFDMEQVLLSIQRAVERSVTEKALKESERFAHATVDALSSHLVILNETGTILAVNRAWHEFAKVNTLGDPNCKVCEGANYLTVCDTSKGRDSEEAAEVAAGIRAVMSGEQKEFSLEYPCHSPKEKRWFIARVTRFPGEGPLRIVVAHENITKRKQAEEALRNSEKRFRALIENGRDNISLLAVDGTLLWENPSTVSTLGYAQNQFIGHNIFELMHPDDQVQIQDQYTQLVQTPGRKQDGTFRMQHGDGRWRWIECTAANMLNEPSVQAMVMNYRDITERKQIEDELRQSDQRFRQLANNIQETFWITEAGSGREIYISPSAEKVWGIPVEDIYQGRYLFLDSVLPEDRQIAVDALEKQSHGEKTEMEYRIQHPDGSVHWIWDRAFPVLDETGKVLLVTGIAADITERKQAEEAQKQSELQFRALFELSPDAVMLIDPHDPDISWPIIDCNTAACRMNGYSRDELIGQSIDIVNVEHDTLSNRNAYIKRIREVGNVKLETFHRHKNGTVFPIEVATSLIKVGDRELMIGIDRDITERKQAEDALHESEERFKDAFQYSAIGMALVSLEGKCLKVNSKLCSILGYSEDELLARTIQDITHPDDLDIDLNYLNQLLSGEIKSYTMEKRYFNKEGKIVWAFLAVALATNHAGAPQYFISQINDITERKQSEVALRESEALYRQAIEVAGAVPYLQSYNNNGTEIHYDFIGEEIHQITGYRADEFTGVLWDSLIQESVLLGDLANYSMEEAIRRVRTGETSLWKCEHLIRARDGNIHWVFETAVELYAENGTAKGSIGMFQDITERKRAEEDIRQRVKELELLYESGLVFSQLLNQKEIAQKIIELLGEKLDWHHTAIRLVRPHDELELVAFDQPGLENKIETQTVEAHLRKSITRLDEGLSGWALQQSKIMRIGDVNSEPHYVKSYPGMQSGLYVPLKSGKQNVGVISIESEQLDAFSEADEQLLATLANQAANAFENARLFQTARQEIIERKRVEKLLADEKNQLAQRVDERTSDLSRVNADLAHAVRVKDEFLASMSHELRTPLTGILGLSEVLQLRIYGELNERQSKAVKNIEESGRHLLELINDILDLSKIEAGKLELQFAAYSLTDICQASLQLIKGMAQHKHQHVNYSPPTETIIVQADARRLKQLLVNLLSNAIKFTPENGELGLDVEAFQSERKIKLTVWDKGIGIKPEDMDKLFKPFTQLDSGLAREYSGTGLGLSLVKHLTEMHSGGIEVESNIGQGSRFTIILPWSPQNTTPIPYSMQRGHTGGLYNTALSAEYSKSPLVMYVDDNEMVLQMVSDFLESKQYRVMKVRSGLELLERAAEAHPNIMLVDIQMPGIGGMETIRRIRSHPDPVVAAAPVIAVTALAMPADRERCLRAGANDYMSKPLKLKELAATIQKLLERKQ